jgi:hypothetical protein
MRERALALELEISRVAQVSAPGNHPGYASVHFVVGIITHADQLFPYYLFLKGGEILKRTKELGVLIYYTTIHPTVIMIVRIW